MHYNTILDLVAFIPSCGTYLLIFSVGEQRFTVDVEVPFLDRKQPELYEPPRAAQVCPFSHLPIASGPGLKVR